MRVNEREKKYLVALAITLVLAAAWFVFKSLFLPYQDKMADLQMKIDELTMMKQLDEIRIAKLETFRERENALQSEAIAVAEAFFPELPQDRILTMIDEMTEKAGIRSDSRQYAAGEMPQRESDSSRPPELNYFDDLTRRIRQQQAPADGPVVPGPEGEAPNPSDEGVREQAKESNESKSVHMSSATMQMQTTFASLKTFIRDVEALGKTIRFDSVALSRGDDGGLTGTMTMTWFAVAKVADDNSMVWEPEATDGREDLFRQYYATPGRTTEQTR